MNTTLVIAAVTAILKNQFENGLVSHNVIASIGHEAMVSALPPDRITTGSDERPQLNLFLHQITPHTALGLSRYSATRSAMPQQQTLTPLDIDLHYMVTAYGAQDFQIEVLLGYALQLLHTMSVVQHDTVQAALKSPSSENGHVVTPALIALAETDIARFIERLEVCPQFLDSEAMSKLWSALQACYRPSLACKVSVTLREESLEE